MSTIDAAQPSAQDLRQQLDFETLVSDLSSRFVNLSSGAVDGEIEVALRRICEALGVDLAILWQWSRSAPEVITPTHSYCRLGRCATVRADAPGAVPLGARGNCWAAARWS
ncbi:MAG: hypothetical protein MZW92_02165 [Comamonadaceae bacterium]|nr:hypothetical protein [Comamonadaceae bacterium]